MANKKISPGWSVFLSIVCLIPILGGILGLVLLILGIAVYKNNFLLVIGATGVGVTGIMILTLNYYEHHRGPFDRSRIIVAQKRMEELIREIELFKIKNGKYSPTLNELTFLTDKRMTVDPLQEVNRPPRYPLFFLQANCIKLLFVLGRI